MTTRYGRDGGISDRLQNYYLNRAAGGASMIVTEPVNGHRFQSDPRKLDAYNGACRVSVSELTEHLTEHQCHLIGQFQDNGRGRREIGRNDAAIGPSALPDDLSWTVPHVLTGIDIQRLVKDFVQAACHLQEAGVAGVELSAGHGHLFHQFLSPWSNQREDEYGGDLEGRCRLLVQLISSIRKNCGDEFLIGVKLPGGDGIAGSIDETLAFEIAKVMGEASIDYWTFAWGSHSESLYQHLPDAHGERGPYTQVIKTLRQASPLIPTGALGYLTDPNEAERLLKDGSAELVMLGRALITDPAWGVKAADNREADIRYCVSCNTCWRTIVEGDGLACDNNPRVGEVNEQDWYPTKSQNRKRIVVVGAGIAGMECGWVLACRGHDVIVLGAGSEVGGKTRVHSLLPGGENLSSIYDYQYLKATGSKARLELGFKAGLDDVLSLEPDHVVLATGSRLSWPSFLPNELKDVVVGVREFAATWVGNLSPQEGRLLLFDQDHTEMTYAVAEYFADLFEGIVLVTPRERIASDVSLVNRQGIYQRLMNKRVDLVTCCLPQKALELDQGLVRVSNVFNQDEQVLSDIVGVTFATPRVPNDELLQPLKNAGLNVDCIGDCHAPRSVMTATREGHRLGNLL